MTRKLLLGMLLVQVVTLGCGASAKTVGPLEAHVTGLIVQDQSKHQYAYVDLTQDITVGDDCQGVELPANEKIGTKHWLKIDVEQQIAEKHYKYTALFGPHRDTDETAEGELKNSAPSFHVGMGWVYLIGHLPVGETKRVRAIADGTRMIIQYDSQGDADRVYLLEVSQKDGKGVTVRHKTDTSCVEKRLEVAGYYIETVGTGCPQDPKKIDDDPKLRQFISGVLELADLAGMKGSHP